MRLHRARGHWQHVQPWRMKTKTRRVYDVLASRGYRLCAAPEPDRWAVTRSGELVFRCRTVAQLEEFLDRV